MSEANGKDNPSLPVADMEPAAGDEPLGTEECQALDTQRHCCLHIHSRRKRLCDADGISGKAVIDGIVRIGLLPDDSPRYVQKVSYSQEKAQQEETVIEVWQ